MKCYQKLIKTNYDIGMILVDFNVILQWFLADIVRIRIMVWSGNPEIILILL